MGASFIRELLGWLAIVLSAAALAAVVAALAGRWQLARRIAKAAVLGMIAYPVLAIVMLVAFAVHDAESKAFVLAKTISNAMNCSPAGMAAVVVWVLAARRLRRARAH